jgi:hypothetical protein
VDNAKAVRGSCGGGAHLGAHIWGDRQLESFGQERSQGKFTAPAGVARVCVHAVRKGKHPLLY